jgi:23S rRNA (uracil1939-C5)-methyltransferase
MIDHPMVPCRASESRRSLAETLTIEKLVYGGDGLARSDGKVIFIPYVLPGETVQAEIDRVKNDLWRGRLVEVTSPSASRVKPECPYFQRCGGCNYQHADYLFQLDQKRSILREVLRRVGKIEFEGEIEALAGQPWQYRNRAQLHIENGAAGYFEHASHTLVPIDRCPIVSPVLNDAITKLNAELPAFRWFTGSVELFTNETDVQVNVLDRIPGPIRQVFETLGTSGPIEYDGFRVGRNSFFQVNRFLISQLVDATVGDATGDSAVDLYAGVGLFSARLAKQFKQVTAVESSRGAFYDLQHNVPNVFLENKTTEEYLARLEQTPDLILLDPPRAGLGKEVVRELIRIHAPHVTIVSCDPATLARDLQALLAGGYKIDKITLIDLFPQTFHLETIVHLSATQP